MAPPPCFKEPFFRSSGYKLWYDQAETLKENRWGHPTHLPFLLSPKKNACPVSPAADRTGIIHYSSSSPAPPFPENCSLRHHGPSWFHAWSAAVFMKPCTVKMDCRDSLRLSMHFIVRAVLPSLSLFWKWPCIFITFSYLILNNIKNETTKAPKRSSIRPWPSSFRLTAPLIRSWPDFSSSSCFLN